MDTKRKIIVLSRHGNVSIVNGERQDEITVESVANLYNNTGRSLQSFTKDYSLTPWKTFLLHSEKVRTLQTGKAILAGAFQFYLPKSIESLNSLNFSGLDIREHPGLSFASYKFNEAAASSNLDDYLTRIIADPSNTLYEGVEITPFDDITQIGRSTLVDALNLAIKEDKDLGVLASHASVVEGQVIAALNSALSTPITDVRDIGGLFGKEAYAKLILDQKGKTDSYEAHLEREGQIYPVDLANLYV